MNKYVVRQPIKNKDQDILGYEILFGGEKGGLYNETNDFAAADTISGFLMQNNKNIFSGGIAFITFTPNLLFKNTPKIFETGTLVIQIEDSFIIHPLAQGFITRYKKAGYEIAINDFQFNPRYLSMMDNIDYIKVDFSIDDEASLANIVKTASSFKKKCIATKVNTKEGYDCAMKLNVDYFQGSYIADVMLTKANKTDYLQSNFFQLVVAITKDEPNMNEIEEIISRDAALTYGILKMVNSVYFALKHRTSSVGQALVILGLAQLKRWVYLLSFKQDDTKGSEEILKLSFLRANFCSELQPYAKDMPISKSEAYLMGMFSTLGYLIDATMEEIFEEIPIRSEIKDAIMQHDGRCGMLYLLVLSYEKADWGNITKYAEMLGIPKNIIAQIYFDCVEDVNQTWDSLTNSFE